jgi:hypothetical protein
VCTADRVRINADMRRSGGVDRQLLR